VIKVEKTERVNMNLVILLNQACLEPLAAQQYRVNYGFDKVQLRIYDTDKLAADNLVACATYEHPSDDEMEHEEASLTGYLSTDSELTESLKHLCTQELARPGRTVLQDIAEEAEGTQRWCSFCRLTCTTARQHPLPSLPAWQQAT